MAVIFEDIVEGEKPSSAVIKYTINHDLDTVLVSDIQQGLKIFCCSELEIDLEIIADIIAMVGSSLENGIKIDRCYTQI